MNYEKINKVLMQILEKKYNVKINAKVIVKETKTKERGRREEDENNI